VKVSVLSVADGDVVLLLVLVFGPLLSHAAVVSTSANATGITRLMRSSLGNARQAGRQHLWISEKAYQNLITRW